MDLQSVLEPKLVFRIAKCLKICVIKLVPVFRVTITLKSVEEDPVFDNPAKKLTPIPWSTLIEDTISP